MGIGPEVTARALIADPPPDQVVLIGQGPQIRSAAASAGLELEQIADLSQATGPVCLLSPQHGDEPVPVAAIRLAAQACLHGEAAAMVTGPIHKGRLAAQGFSHRGHTDLLGEICGVSEPVMAFVGGRLRVALVTTHIPLGEVESSIDSGLVAHVVRTAAQALRDDLGLEAPRIGVCGLNPHAGEGGLLGDTEQTQIGPACETLRAEGWNIRGPISAETAFMDAGAGALDLVVAMYHDQGLVPLKLVDFGRSVNWTLGLPIIRTSVDHGTADDLVGTGRANPASMVAAIGLARTIAARRRTC
jgi:4-hydroxythreonine-4-phosphate dehydrogenase